MKTIYFTQHRVGIEFLMDDEGHVIIETDDTHYSSVITLTKEQVEELRKFLAEAESNNERT